MILTVETLDIPQYEDIDIIEGALVLKISELETYLTCAKLKKATYIHIAKREGENAILCFSKNVNDENL